MVDRNSNGDIIVPRTETVTDEQIKNLLCAAFEGGIGYWVNDVLIVDKDGNEVERRPEQADYYYESLLYGCDLKMHDRVEEEECDDDSVWHTLTLDAAIKALPRAATHYRRSINGFAEDHDSESADVWIQLAVFDNIVYG